MIEQLPKITVLTLNCNGAKQDAKRRALYHFLRTQQVDIICLQETHTPSASADHWTATWAGPAVWSKHVGILLSSRHRILSHSLYLNDRLLLAEVSVRGCVFTVANMYAPAHHETRRPFFKSISSTLDFDPYSVAFIAGDWNSCPDPLHDRNPPRDSKNLWRYLAPSLSEYFDAALQGAARHYFTYDHRAQAVSARLDHIFASRLLEAYSFSTSLVTYLGSDHKAVRLTVTPPDFRRPTIWRLNSSLLDRQDLRTLTEQHISSADSAMWDVCKVLVRSSSRDVAALAANQRNAKTRHLQRVLQRAENVARARKISVYADPASVSARAALREHTELAASRAILRARVDWKEKGERCSTYFYDRFRKSKDSDRLIKLRDDQGHDFATTLDRHDHVRAFYTRLYADPTYDMPSCQSFLGLLSLPRLRPAEVASLSAPITAEELTAVVRRLPLRRSPGPDGLPYEWYRTFLSDLFPLLLTMFNGILCKGDPPPDSWATTTMRLIPKPGRDHSEIRNWRPITLANCDAKIFSRILANRLALILPRLLHPDQAGFVRGRSAPDVALTIKTVLAHAAVHKVDGALVFLDQEKAYDRVSHRYLSAVLQHFGFSATLSRVFAQTSGPSYTFINDDGHFLPAVSISCGVRQGDPLAPLLFNLAVEPLLAAIRLRLAGVALPWGSFKTGAFADDLTVGLSTTDVPALESVLAQYRRASNGRINVDKSVILDLSGSPTTPQWILDTGFTVHDHQLPIRVLGFDLILNPDGVKEDWMALYTQMQAVANSLVSRRCSLQGRALLANSKVLSMLWYKGRLSIPNPRSVIFSPIHITNRVPAVRQNTEVRRN